MKYLLTLALIATLGDPFDLVRARRGLGPSQMREWKTIKVELGWPLLNVWFA